MDKDQIGAIYTVAISNGFSQIMNLMAAIQDVLNIKEIEPLGELNKEDLIKGMADFKMLMNNIILSETARIDAIAEKRFGPQYRDMKDEFFEQYGFGQDPDAQQ